MKTLIIAECGVNHNGNEDEAYRLIDAATQAGAGVAKFQLYKPELLAEPGETRDILEWLLLQRDAYVRLYEYCRAKGIGFACTAFDADSLRFLLDNTQMEFVKISSGQGDNKELLELAGSCGLRVIQSLKKPPHLSVRMRNGWDYLHVVPEYPTLPESAGLRNITPYWCSGLSDHSGDIFMPLAAVALGAKIIECHITLDKNQEGPDHRASLNPQQFSEMVRGIRSIEKGMA